LADPKMSDTITDVARLGGYLAAQWRPGSHHPFVGEICGQFMSDVQFDLGLFPQLRPQELHLWCVDFDRSRATIDRLVECLSDEERQRSQRFLRDVDRQQFIVSHGAVRTILGQYLGIPPGHIEIKIGPGGKPQLANSPHFPPLHHNLSHSERLAMIAVTLDHEVGVDVERIRPSVDIESIVQRFFAPGERTRWQALPDHERLAAFFRCWTRKEAYLKARGIGLSSGLDQFEVSLAPGEPARLLRGDIPGDSPQRWQMHDVSPAEEYMAACVVEQGIDRLSLYEWPILRDPIRRASATITPDD
jgi:4'-phosphopantetheinyl transferase